MMKKLILVTALLLGSMNAEAMYTHRLNMGVGVSIIDSGSTTKSYLSVGGEYEYRFSDFLGMGMLGTYVFSDPSITFLGLPEVFLHPLATDWFVSAAPVVEFGSSIGTHYGARFGTRIPISFGIVSLIPEGAVTFINGGKTYSFGFGIQI